MDTELVYAYAKTNALGELDTFIHGTHQVGAPTRPRVRGSLADPDAALRPAAASARRRGSLSVAQPAQRGSLSCFGWSRSALVSSLPLPLLSPAPPQANLQSVGDRCFDEGMYEAARVLFAFIPNWGRLASTLVRLHRCGPACFVKTRGPGAAGLPAGRAAAG